METSVTGRIFSVVGGAFLLVGAIFSLASAFSSLNLLHILNLPLASSTVLFLSIGSILVGVCAFALMFAQDATAIIVVGAIGLISSIVFGGIFGMVGGILGIIGGSVNFKTSSAIGIGFGCTILCSGLYYGFLAKLGMGNTDFVTASLTVFVGLFILVYGTFELRKNMDPSRSNLVSAMILSAFWAIYAFLDPVLLEQATREGIMHTWQTVPWILSVILTAALQVFFLVNSLSRRIT